MRTFEANVRQMGKFRFGVLGRRAPRGVGSQFAFQSDNRSTGESNDRERQWMNENSCEPTTSRTIRRRSRGRPIVGRRCSGLICDSSSFHALPIVGAAVVRVAIVGQDINSKGVSVVEREPTTDLPLVGPGATSIGVDVSSGRRTTVISVAWWFGRHGSPAPKRPRG